MKFIPVLILLVLFISCRKNNSGKNYIIRGQVLESSSNPVPVSNYTISFYQKANSGLLGGVQGLDTMAKTGGGGIFSFQYNAAKNYGLSRGGTNPNDIHITGVDTAKYKGLYPRWYSIPSLQDINLNTIFLFKKIDLLVRKIQFINPLNAGESLVMITTDSSAASYKTITGPIPGGTLLTVDTIRNCKLTWLNTANKTYTLTAVLQKPSFQKDTSLILSQGDEAYREILIRY